MELVKCYFMFLASICVPLAGEELLFDVVKSQFVKVDPKVTAYLGGEVTIRCEYILEASTAKIVQVEWRKEPSASAFAVFHPEFGKTYTASSLEGRVHFTSSHVNDASISISNVNETDEGVYTCAYTTYPGGSYIATTTLTVRALADLNSSCLWDCNCFASSSPYGSCCAPHHEKRGGRDVILRKSPVAAAATRQLRSLREKTRM
ncbi:hypothetical protein GJAV_G00005940 [Gymnothorax javanicus]|nr:hypothetical protein GJAV_G00005940 [Gymnothorax javanicus]